MRQKPLFPHPVDPESGKRCKNRGTQKYVVVSIIGEIALWRQWWSCPSSGSFDYGSKLRGGVFDINNSRGR